MGIPCPVPGVRVDVLMAADLAAAGQLTFPAYRPLLARCVAPQPEGPGPVPIPIARVLRHRGEVIGLALGALGSLLPGGETGTRPGGRLDSLMLLSPWRRQGLGRYLLGAWEAALGRGPIRLEARYNSTLPGLAALEACLGAAGWGSPVTEQFMYRCHLGRVTGDWLQAAPHWADTRSHLGLQWFPWSGLAPGERATLLAEVAAGQIPRELSPFEAPDLLIPDISVGVRQGGTGQVLGWMIVQRSPVSPHTLCYRSLFVRPGLRMARGLGPALVAAALARHRVWPGVDRHPLGVFAVAAGSVKMRNFFQRRLAGACISQHEARWVGKGV